MKCNKNL